jgi:serine/threonine protein kinase
MIDNEFTLINILGKGGSSKVFLAENSLGERCAIKILEKK